MEKKYNVDVGAEEDENWIYGKWESKEDCNSKGLRR